MVLGALLGGAVTRLGERAHEESLRQRQIEDWQRQNSLNLKVDFLSKNWENLYPEQQKALIGGIAKDLGQNPEKFYGLVGGVESIAKILPAIQAGPGAIGRPAPSPEFSIMTPPQVPGPAIQPEFEKTPGRVPVSISELPQVPGQLYAPAPSQTIRTPSLTPAQVTEERKLEQARQIRNQKLADLRASNLPPDIKQIGEALIGHGINISPYEIAQMRGAQQQAALAAKAAEFRGSARVIMRNGYPLPIRATAKGEFILDPQSGWIPYTPELGDEVYEKPIPLGFQTGATDVYAVTRSPKGEVRKTPLNIGTPPARVSAPQSQLTTVTTPEGPAVVEYQPTRGGGAGTIRTVQQGAIKGYSETTQTKNEQLAMLKDNIASLNNLIQKPHVTGRIGPISGRLTDIQRQAIDVGKSPEQNSDINEMFRITNDLSDMLLRARSGAQINEQEYRRLRNLTPNPKTPIGRFKSDLAGFTRELNVVLKRRGLLAASSVTQQGERWTPEKEARYQDLKRRQTGGK